MRFYQFVLQCIEAQFHPRVEAQNTLGRQFLASAWIGKKAIPAFPFL
jgi:hypothetical protein